MEHDECRARLELVRVVSCYKDDKEGEEIGGCREGLCGKGAVTHVAKYGGQEDGHAAESYIAAEEHELLIISLVRISDG